MSTNHEELKELKIQRGVIKQHELDELKFRISLLLEEHESQQELWERYCSV
jgi:hypothetical protein